MSRVKLANSLVSRLRAEIAKGVRPGYKKALGLTAIGAPGMLVRDAFHFSKGGLPVSNRAEMLDDWYKYINDQNLAKTKAIGELEPTINTLRNDLVSRYPNSRFADRALNAKLKMRDLENLSPSTGLGKELSDNMHGVYDMAINSPNYASTMFNKLVSSPVNDLAKQILSDKAMMLGLK